MFALHIPPMKMQKCLVHILVLRLKMTNSARTGTTHCWKLVMVAAARRCSCRRMERA
jgi:hypothetical protein